MIEFYTTETFKNEYDKLVRKNSYKDLGESIITELLEGNIELGTVLNFSNPNQPFIKRRVNGRGGFRLYLLILKLKDRVIIGYVHPKRGTLGVPNVTKDKIKLILKDIIDSTKNNDLYVLTKCPTTHSLVFSKKEIVLEAAE